MQPPVNALSLIQQEYEILELGGKFGLIRPSDLLWKPGMGAAPGLRVYQKQDANLAIKRSLQLVPATNKSSQVIEDFWTDPSTAIYRRIAFSPKTEPADTLNLWIGPTVTPAQGNWQTIELYLKCVLCAGDIEAYNYLIAFLAHMLQKPEEKPGVMIVMLGGEGIGKGTLEIILRSIFAATTVMVSDIDSVIGRFNSVLERAYVVFMDEALFHGDKKSTERLKSFITSEHIQIEEKHQPERTIRSYHRFFAASNEQHFAHIGHDARRMFYLRVSEIYKGNHAYWNKLYKAIDTGEVEAMAYDLMKMDISEFNIRKPPKSVELLSQKIQSLPPFPRFWFDVLWQGQYPDLSIDSKKDWKTGGFWKTQDIINAYQNHAKSAQRFKTITAQELADNLKRLCPAAIADRKMVNKQRGWGYCLPSIEDARQDFDKYLGGPQNWPELND
jgi:hypothetical protein